MTWVSFWFVRFFVFCGRASRWLCPAPSAKHEVKQHRLLVRFRQLPRQGPVSNNNNTRPSALAETRGRRAVETAMGSVTNSQGAVEEALIETYFPGALFLCPTVREHENPGLRRELRYLLFFRGFGK